MRAGEDEYSALPGRLSEKLSPNGAKIKWDIDPECLGAWYRPNFDNPMVKECIASSMIINFFAVSICTCSCVPSKRKDHALPRQITSKPYQIFNLYI